MQPTLRSCSFEISSNVSLPASAIPSFTVCVVRVGNGIQCVCPLRLADGVRQEHRRGMLLVACAECYTVQPLAALGLQAIHQDSASRGLETRLLTLDDYKKA